MFKTVLLTSFEQVQFPYWEIVVFIGHCGTELAVHGLYKNYQGPIFPKGQHSVLLK